jgi:hypothetical protein
MIGAYGILRTSAPSGLQFPWITSSAGCACSVCIACTSLILPKFAWSTKKIKCARFVRKTKHLLKQKLENVNPLQHVLQANLCRIRLAIHTESAQLALLVLQASFGRIRLVQAIQTEHAQPALLVIQGNWRPEGALVLKIPYAPIITQ